jgi:hypothetical protein
MVARTALANAIFVESGQAALATYQFSALSGVSDGFISVAQRAMQLDKLIILFEDQKDFLRMNDLRFSLSDLDGLLNVFLRADLGVFDLLTFGSVGAPGGALLRLMIIIRITLSSALFLKNPCAAAFLVAGQLDPRVGRSGARSSSEQSPLVSLRGFQPLGTTVAELDCQDAFLLLLLRLDQSDAIV